MKRNGKSLVNRRNVLAGIAAISLPGAARAGAAEVRVWKTATCGCCKAWVDHLTQAGFAVRALDIDHDKLDQIKDRLGVPQVLRSCHTAEVGRFVIEGHVPAADIELLLSFKPEVAGLAVPGMPIGSPGMEMGDEFEPYATYAFDKTGPVAIFAKHGGA